MSGWQQSRYVRTDSDRRTPISLSGRRAVFFLEEAVVHLGAAFNNSEDALPTTTSLEQRLSALAPITYGLSNGTSSTIPGTGGGVTNTGINWVHYQNVGYLPPGGGLKILRDVTQTNAGMTYPAERIVSLWVDQSSPVTTNLTFDWAVLPVATLTTVSNYASPASRPWTIVTNTAAIQSVFVPARGWLGAVFHETNATLSAPGLAVSVNRPTVLLITTHSNQVATLYVGDPYENMVPPYNNKTVPYTNLSMRVTQMNVTINGKAFTVKLPPWPHLGKTAVSTVSLSATNIAPAIVRQPGDAQALAGESATFSVGAAGVPSVSYQWQRNGTNIAGATNTSYTLTAAAAYQNAAFRCVVSNSLGVAISTAGILAVTDVPTISTVPDQFVAMNQSTPPLPFTVNHAFTDAALLSVSAASSNPALVPDANVALAGGGANRFVTVTPASSQTGYATVTLTVSDGNTTGNSRFLVVVREAAVNRPPIVEVFSNQTLMAGQTLSVPTVAHDPDTPPQRLLYSFLTAPAGASSHPTNGLISWRPTLAQAGSNHLFTVQATETGWLTNLRPVADAYVQDGVYASNNYGASSSLLAKLSGTASQTRESYLRFPLPAVTGTMASATLQLMPLTASLPATHAVALVTNDNWLESNITWNNKPSSGVPLATWQPQAGVRTSADVTTAAASSLGGDQLLSLRVHATNSTADGLVQYGSKEGTAANTPVLALDSSNFSTLSATQSFWVTVTTPLAPTISTHALAGGHLQFTVAGPPGPDYTIWGSTNLIQWSPLLTTNSPILPFTWMDPDTDCWRQKFYRIQLGP